MKHLLILLFLIISSTSYSQTYFNNLYGNPESNKYDIANGVMATDTGYYLSFISSYSDAGYLKRFSGLLYIDTDGVIQDTFSILNPLWTIGALNTIETLDGGFLIQLDAGTYGDTTNNFDYYLVKIDKDFNEEWSTRYYTPYYDVSRDILALTDSSFLVFGLAELTSGVNVKYKLQKIDKNGNILWIKYYGHYARYSVPSFIEETSDGGFFMVGIQKEGYNSIPRSYMIKVDNNGNEEWSRWNGSIDSRSGLNGFIELSNGNYLIYGGDVKDNSSTDFRDLDSYIAEINPINGTVIKEKHFEKEGYEFIKEAILQSDNSLLIRASLLNENDRSIAKLFKIDSNWDIIWERTFYRRTDISQYIYDMEQAPDGGFILVGSARSDTSQDMWVIKTDSLGCDVAGCEFVSNNEVEPIVEEIISIYPNPFNTDLNIIMEHNSEVWTITDITGKLIQTGIGTQPLNTINWQSGMYFLRTQEGAVKKMIKM